MHRGIFEQAETYTLVYVECLCVSGDVCLLAGLSANNNRKFVRGKFSRFLVGTETLEELETSTQIPR